MQSSKLSYTAYYVIGFVLSLILTLAAYFTVTLKIFTPRTILVLISAFAILQFIAQLLFFLRIAQEKKPHWKLILFFFMILVLLIIVFGTLWIMNSLNYNLMPHNMETDAY